MSKSSPDPKLIYLLLLSLLGLGSFGFFSGTELNFFLKGYGLAFVLQAGFALLYLGVYRRRRLKP
ncbi:hypothetical protein [Lusitaniella coriacea]|uniref:hypothetical protein n=1 Tax=Lusitaniella coriacea TaxID=1983105 RepID=UPI003CF095AA